MRLLALLLVATLFIVEILGTVEKRPVIAILSQPDVPNLPDGYPRGSIREWLSDQGAATFYLDWNTPDDLMDEVLSNLHGIVFPGGPQVTNSTEETPFMRVSRRIYSHALENDIALLGICQGFQQLNILSTGNPEVLRTPHRYWARPSTLNWYEPPQCLENGTDCAGSKLMQAMPTAVRNAFTYPNSIAQLHDWGVSTEEFYKYGSNQHFNILATDYDENGVQIVAMMEHKTRRMFGTQFHPERNPILYCPECSADDQTFQAGREANSWLARFFVANARLSARPNWTQDMLEKWQVIPFNGNYKLNQHVCIADDDCFEEDAKKTIEDAAQLAE